MTTITSINAPAPTTPEVVTAHRNLWGFVPFIVWHGYLGPLLIVAGLYAPAIDATDRPALIILGAIATALVGPFFIRAVARHIKARLTLASFVIDHAPTMTDAERRYFIRHAVVEITNEFSAHPVFTFSAPADARKLVTYSLTVR
ncbi:hypothetical protein GCM10025867_51400 (plasmid) [Frondihabitans sucicola]|uniref:PH domain-containing protein n=1 Tax=Frondihabitans sucicola TaxID=1268041 RepID=A0ABN6Y4S4_9MICO|nr:hypothetical protein [Frondihabitans sucicola]BDZ52332.1 hypothetical protein GCM10025867_45730 [Frondihabitans sucicola]BDZ52899.1 hypothetical protein GCM10025867_51400 [Frondihabitans sucicola]